MKTFSRSSCISGPLPAGAICSCTFGFIHEFSAAKGVLGLVVVEIIE